MRTENANKPVVVCAFKTKMCDITVVFNVQFKKKTLILLALLPFVQLINNAKW